MKQDRDQTDEGRRKEMEGKRDVFKEQKERELMGSVRMERKATCECEQESKDDKEEVTRWHVVGTWELLVGVFGEKTWRQTE